MPISAVLPLITFVLPDLLIFFSVKRLKTKGQTNVYIYKTFGLLSLGTFWSVLKTGVCPGPTQNSGLSIRMCRLAGDVKELLAGRSQIFSAALKFSWLKSWQLCAQDFCPSLFINPEKAGRVSDESAKDVVTPTTAKQICNFSKKGESNPESRSNVWRIWHGHLYFHQKKVVSSSSSVRFWKRTFGGETQTLCALAWVMVSSRAKTAAKDNHTVKHLVPQNHVKSRVTTSRHATQPRARRSFIT